MGLFGSSTRNESKIVLNFNTFATDGHAILVMNEPVKDIMKSRKHLLKVRPRDCHESHKDYEQQCKKEYLLPVVENYLLTNDGWSEHKQILIALPNRIEDLPYGLNQYWREALMQVILHMNVDNTVIEGLQRGIRQRDELYKESLGLEFATDYKDQVDKWVKDAYSREMPKYPKQEEKHED